MKHPVLGILSIGAVGMAGAAVVNTAIPPEAATTSASAAVAATGAEPDLAAVFFSVLAKSPELAAIVAIVLLFLRDRKGVIGAFEKFGTTLERLTAGMLAQAEATKQSTAAAKEQTRTMKALQRSLKATPATARAGRDGDDDDQGHDLADDSMPARGGDGR